MAIQWPLVKAQLLAVLPTLPGWGDVDFYNGPPVGDGVALVSATIGYVPGNVNAGDGATTQALDGFQRIESGSIHSRLMCAVGDDDLASVEAQAFTLIDTFDVYIRANRTLGGVLSPQGTSDLAWQVLAAADGDSSSVALDFTVTYTTHT